MSDVTLPLLLDLDVVSLTMSLVNIESPTGAESGLADSIESALAPLVHLTVERVGASVVAHTQARGATAERVLVLGHLDTVAGGADPVAYVEMGRLFGAGACDAKGGLAVMLKAAMTTYDRHITFVFHAGGETSSGLAALATERPDLLDADLAVVLEPTSGGVASAHTDDPGIAALLALAEQPAPPAAPPACSPAEVLTSRTIPTAVFGPGDPGVAHTAGEFVPTAELTQCEYVLRTWLQG